jgi:ABC-type dipeptide/oligopeptide/nickel transport system permease subunit
MNWALIFWVIVPSVVVGYVLGLLSGYSIGRGWGD